MNKLVVIISFLYWFFNVLWDFLQLFSRCYCLSTQQITVDLYFYHFISSIESFQQKETYEGKLMCVTNSKSDVPMYLILLARWTRHIFIKCTISFCEAFFPPIFNRSHSLSLPVSPSRFYKVLTGYLLIQIYWPKIRYYRRDFPLSELCATSPRRGLFLHRLACILTHSLQARHFCAICIVNYQVNIVYMYLKILHLPWRREIMNSDWNL